MSEGLRKKLIYATLPAAVIWALFNLNSSEESSPEPPPTVAVSPAVVPAAAQPTATRPSPRPTSPQIDIATAQARQWGLDPFRSYLYNLMPSARTESSFSWVLGGIIYNNQRPMAFVNNRPVKIGDQINQATVIAIDRETVTLEFQGKEIKLKVDKG